MTSDIPALAGGTPIREEILAFARPDLGAEEEAAVLAVLRSGWLATGPRTAELERAFAALVGVPHAVATTSWTAAMHLLLRAFGVGPGAFTGLRVACGVAQGLAVALDTPGGIERLFHVKQRPPDKGIALLLADAAQADRIGVLGAAGGTLRVQVFVHLYPMLDSIRATRFQT